MSLSHITTSSDFDAEIVGSSASLVILSDTEEAIAAVPAIAQEIALKVVPEAEAAICQKTASPSLATASNHTRDGVRILKMVSESNHLKRNPRSFIEAMASGMLQCHRSTDKAKITRKRLKPDKHGHGNGRARKKPGGSYQSQTLVNLQSTWSTKVKGQNKGQIPIEGQKGQFRQQSTHGQSNTSSNAPYWLTPTKNATLASKEAQGNIGICTNYTHKESTRGYIPRIATLAIRVTRI
ncbi:hypothetical protein Tco_0985818 [Tanacetum coccineum]